MQTKNINIYGIDCTVLTTLPEIELAVQRILRAAPDLIVFYAPGRATTTFLDIVKTAFESGCAVMLTANKLTSPSATNWLEKSAR